jgi:hypothetical protein
VQRKTNLMHNLSWVYFIKHLYMFWAYPPPIIRRYTICLQQLVFIVLFRWLSVVLAGSNPARTTDSHLKRTISTNICKHTVYLLNAVRTTDSHLKRKISTNICKHMVYLLNAVRTTDSHLKRTISTNPLLVTNECTKITYCSNTVLIIHIKTN